MTQFTDETDGFVNWLRTNGSILSKNIEVADLRTIGQGRGLIATADIEVNEDLFTLPRTVVLNVETSALSARSPEIKEKLLKAGHWESLILILLYEKSLGEKSKWLPYLNVLPKTFSTLIYWTDEELDQLKPSLVLNRIGKEEAQQMYEKLFPAFSEDLGFTSSIEEFNEVASVIMSYSFDAERPDFEEEEQEEQEQEEDEEEEASTNILSDGYFKSMVPLADTLNADTTLCNANLYYEEESLVMRAISPIKKGEQIYNTYGDHPNAEILRRYGYVEWNGSKFDFGEIPLVNIRDFLSREFNFSDEFIESVFEIIAETELEEIEEPLIADSYDCYNNGDITPELTILLQVLNVIYQADKIESIQSQSEDVQSKSINRILKKCYQLVESGKITKSVNDTWSKILASRYADYPSVASEAFTVPTGDASFFNKTNISQCVLKSEYQSLKKCETPFNDLTLIDDDKLLRNIVKRKAETSASTKTKTNKKPKH